MQTRCPRRLNVSDSSLLLPIHRRPLWLASEVIGARLRNIWRALTSNCYNIVTSRRSPSFSMEWRCPLALALQPRSIAHFHSKPRLRRLELHLALTAIGPPGMVSPSRCFPPTPRKCCYSFVCTASRGQWPQKQRDKCCLRSKNSMRTVSNPMRLLLIFACCCAVPSHFV